MRVRMDRMVAPIVVGLAIMLTQSSGVLAGAPCLSRPLITAVRCDKPPVIDGRLGDAAWKQASSSRFVARPGDLRNRIRICRDEDNLYVAVSCQEPHVSTMEAAEESVEVFFSPDDLSQYYYHFVVTAANVRKAEHGTVDCNDRYYRPWLGDWQSAVHRGPNYWQVEMAIRIADLGKEPSPQDRWGLAFTRNRRNEAAGYPSIYWWSPLVGDADVRTAGMHAVYFPHMLGLMRFAESGAVVEDGIGDLFPGLKNAKLTAFGLGDSEAVVRAGSRYYNGEGTSSYVPNTMKIRTRQKLASDVPASVQWAQLADEEVVSVEVVDRATGDVVYASGQRYRRPIARDRVWYDIDCSDRPEALKRELEGLATKIEASDASYEHRLDRWESAKAQLRAGLVARRQEQLMRNGPQENGERAYGIAMASPMTNILPKALMLGRLDYTSKISLQAARNEMEALQVVVYSPHKNLRDVKLAWTDLHGESGARIDSEAIWAAPMGFVNTRPPSDYEVSYVGWWPDPILTYLDRFDIVKSDLQPVWYSVRVPAGTTPGMYHGTLTISPANSASAVIPVELEVWDLTLPDQPSLDTALQYNVPSAYDHERATRERLAALADAVERFASEHRCNPAEYSGPPTAKRSDEATIARWAELGAKTFSVFKTRDYDLDGSGNAPGLAWKDIRRIIAENLALAEKYGLEGQPFVYMPDEATSGLFPAIEKMARWLKKEFPNLKLMTTERLAGYMRDEAAQGLPFGALSGRKNVDWLVIPVGGWHDKHWADNARAQGKEVWWYIASGGHDVPQFHIDESVMEPRLLMGFMAYAYDTDGFLYWSMMSESNNDKKLTGGPYTDWNPRSHGGAGGGDNGIGHMIYPGQDGPITCVRMENWLDGMEDYEYCVLAEKCIQELRAAGRDAEADKLNAVFAPYSDPGNEVIKSLTNYTLDPGVVEAARRKIALAILQGQADTAAK